MIYTLVLRSSLLLIAYWVGLRNLTRLASFTRTVLKSCRQHETSQLYRM